MHTANVQKSTKPRLKYLLKKSHL